eukprot:14757934-Alexandrium_andersonii.AAC.2
MLASESPGWNLGPEVDSWASTIAKRLRAMVRDVSQALLKGKKRNGKPLPEWLVPFTSQAVASTTSGTGSASWGVVAASS